MRLLKQWDAVCTEKAQDCQVVNTTQFSLSSHSSPSHHVFPNFIIGIKSAKDGTGALHLSIPPHVGCHNRSAWVHAFYSSMNTLPE